MMHAERWGANWDQNDKDKRRHGLSAAPAGSMTTPRPSEAAVRPEPPQPRAAACAAHKKGRARGGPAKAADSTLEEVVPRGERPKTASTGRE
jgi:hypothetical protein